MASKRSRRKALTDEQLTQAPVTSDGLRRQIHNSELSDPGEAQPAIVVEIRGSWRIQDGQHRIRAVDPPA